MKRIFWFLFSFFLSSTFGYADVSRGFVQPDSSVKDSAAASTATGDDILLELTVDKERSAVGETLMLTYHLYTRFDTHYEGFEQQPRFKGFWVEADSAESLQKMLSPKTESLKGKKYIRAVIGRYRLLPIFSETQTIDPGIVRVSFVPHRKTVFGEKRAGKRMEAFLKPAPLSIFVNEAGPDPQPEALQKIRKLEKAFSSGAVSEKSAEKQVIILLDVSSSMQAEDLKPENRLGAAKAAIESWTRHYPDLLLTVIPFADISAAALKMKGPAETAEVMKKIQPGMLKDGTAIGDAIFQASQDLKPESAEQTFLILMTDGTQNAGHLDPSTVLMLFGGKKPRIFTMSLGREGLVPFPVEDPEQGKRYVQVEIAPDHALMEQIARDTGARHFVCEKDGQLDEALADVARSIGLAGID